MGFYGNGIGRHCNIDDRNFLPNSLLGYSGEAGNKEILVLYRPEDVFGQTPAEGRNAIIQGQIRPFTLVTKCVGIVEEETWEIRHVPFKFVRLVLFL